MTMTLSVVPVRFEYACGHTALVSLPRVKAESPSQRFGRIDQEKAAARQRACDFCPPVPQPIVVHSNNLVALGSAAAEPAQGSLMHGRIDNALFEPADTDDRLYAKQPEEAGILTTTESAAELKPAPATTPVLMRQKGVFPARKLSDEQELELTRLYAETPTPLGEIGKRYGIALASVARIAQRNGATMRRPNISRAPASAIPVAVAAVRPDQAVEPETTPAALQPATQPTVPPTQGAKPGSSTRRTAPRTDRPTAEAPIEAPVGNPAPHPTATRRSRTPRVAVGNGTELQQFVVSFLAVQTLRADSARDALQQAEALGATEVTSIVRTA